MAVLEFESKVYYLGWRSSRERAVFTSLVSVKGFPGGSDGKESACSAGDMGSIPGSGRFPGEGNAKTTPVSLPGKIPWTEEPGGLQSMGPQRVGCA